MRWIPGRRQTGLHKLRPGADKPLFESAILNLSLVMHTVLQRRISAKALVDPQQNMQVEDDEG